MPGPASHSACDFSRNTSMKPAQIFHQYIWIINTLRAYKQLTLEELNQKWQEDLVADGNPLMRSSFNRHRDAIADMFGIDICCTPKTYKYISTTPIHWATTVWSSGCSRRWQCMACLAIACR